MSSMSSIPSAIASPGTPSQGLRRVALLPRMDTDSKREGTHIWTEETMQGPLWIKEAKKAPDIFWRTHEQLLAQLDNRSWQKGASSSLSAGRR